MDFVEGHWAAIVEAFGPKKRQQTHEMLKLLARERSRRDYGW